MTRRALLALAVAAACLGGVEKSSAARSPTFLPSARTLITAMPPLAGAGTAPSETRVPPGTISRERVHVGLDRRGRPVSVSVLQRLTLHKLGDYSFVVAGPIADVEPGPQTESEPGLRSDAVVWAGFSPGTKMLAARIKLRARPAAPFLPVGVRVDQGRLVITNRTATPTGLVAAPLDARSAAKALEATRRAIAFGPAASDAYSVVALRPPVAKKERISAPLQVSGRVGQMRFVRRIGGDGPTRLSLRVPRGRIHLVVTPEPLLRIVSPPGGASSWADALRRMRIPTSDLLEHVSRIRLTAARAAQYQEFLSNPDPLGSSRSVYVYETTKERAQAPIGEEDSSGNGAWITIVIAVGAVLGTAGLIVLWAHS
jgi:hypothetical protein